MVRRITIALLIGAISAAGLELVNGFCGFLLPPMIVITPLCLIVAIIVTLSIGNRGKSNT